MSDLAFGRSHILPKSGESLTAGSTLLTGSSHYEAAEPVAGASERRGSSLPFGKIFMAIRILILGVLIAFGSRQLAFGSFLNGAADKRKTFVAGETIPSMEGRKSELVPGSIPSRVRYMFAPNPSVNTAAEKLRTSLEGSSRALFNESILVQPGAFRIFADRCNLSGGPKMSVVDPSNLKKGDIGGGLAMMIVNKEDQLVSISKEMARLLKEDGGFDIRSLKKEEMAKWWIYIMFDIEEPVFVIASKKGHFRFVVELNAKDQIAILDDLNGLPK